VASGPCISLRLDLLTEPSDPSSVITNDFKMDKALAYAKKLNEEQQEVHVTITHVFTLAAAWGMYKMRRDVGRLPWGTFKHSKKIGVTVLVDRDGGKDLVPVTLWDGHKMSVIEIAKFMSQRVQRAKSGNDAAHNKSTSSADYLPAFIAQPLAFALTYICATLGISIPAMGLKAETFGHLILTNVGMMGY